MISKFIVIAICVNFAVAGKDHQHDQKFREIAEKCLKILDVTEAEINEIFQKRPLVIGEGKTRCYFQCIMHRLGHTDDDGNITDKFDVNDLPPAFFPYAEECRMNVAGNDACEKAFNFHKCIFEKKEGS